jgi:hypothetical protein
MSCVKEIVAMANVIVALNEHVRKLARREVRARSVAMKRAGAEYRREIAGLKRLIKSLVMRVSLLEKGAGRAGGKGAGGGELMEAEGHRFRADGLRSHRARLGISAREYGKLVGVSGLTVYNWESGKSRPRRKQLAGLVKIRGLGKREIEKLLGE